MNITLSSKYISNSRTREKKWLRSSRQQQKKKYYFGYTFEKGILTKNL
jgi:hypothetical protein